MKASIAALLGLLAAFAAAQDLEPRASSTWVKQGSSLLFFDAAGELSQEIGLRSDDETLGPRTSFQELSGGVSPGGRFAWVLEKNTRYDSRKTQEIESRRELRVYGTSGKLLWSLPGADAPDGLEPVFFSADGETAAALTRGEAGWTLSVRNYLGAELATAGPFERVQGAGLTPNGRYAFVRWLVPDKSATHTFLEVPSKRRVDIQSGELILGLAKISNDGVVTSGQKTVFAFKPEADKTSARPAEKQP